MTKKYYDHDELILRDLLAIDRTVLANERTFLAYVRTALALFAAGASFLQFFRSLWLDAVGYVLVVCGVAVLSIGGIRFLSMRRDIGEAKKQAPDQ